MKNVQELTLQESVSLNGGVHDRDGLGCTEPYPFAPLGPPYPYRDRRGTL